MSKKLRGSYQRLSASQKKTKQICEIDINQKNFYFCQVDKDHWKILAPISLSEEIKTQRLRELNILVEATAKKNKFLSHTKTQIKKRIQIIAVLIRRMVKNLHTTSDHNMVTIRSTFREQEHQKRIYTA